METRRVEFRNHLFTIPIQDWTGKMKTICGCPFPTEAIVEMIKCINKKDIKYPWQEYLRNIYKSKKKGEDGEILIGVKGAGYADSMSCLEVIEFGPYEILSYSPGSAEHFSSIQLRYNDIPHTNESRVAWAIVSRALKGMYKSSYEKYFRKKFDEAKPGEILTGIGSTFGKGCNPGGFLTKNVRKVL